MPPPVVIQAGGGGGGGGFIPGSPMIMPAMQLPPVTPFPQAQPVNQQATEVCAAQEYSVAHCGPFDN